ARVGRADRPVHERRADDDHDPPAEARRPARRRDRDRGRLQARLMRWPAPTIRLRMTVLYGVVFLITGALLLTLGYVLVRHNLDVGARFGEVRQQLQKLGVLPATGTPPLGNTFRFLPGSPEASVAAAVRAQLR